jgi:predicted GIY-YIG superfamily endonuclease
MIPLNYNHRINNYPLNSIVTYVLALDNEKFYVGRVQNGRINRRLNHHQGGSSGWTKVHKPIGVVGVYRGDIEKEKTIELRERFGADNVRGYVWVKVDNPDFVCYEDEIHTELSAVEVNNLFQ